MSKIKYITFNIGTAIASKYPNCPRFNNGWLILELDTSGGKMTSDRKPPEVFEGITTTTITKGQNRFSCEITPRWADIQIEWALQEWQEVEQNGKNSLLTARDYCWPDYHYSVDNNGMFYTLRQGVITLVEPQGTAYPGKNGLFYPDGILIKYECDKSKDY